MTNAEPNAVTRPPPAAAPRDSGDPWPPPRVAILKFLVLLGLWVWLFWPELRDVCVMAPGNCDRAHALAIPVAILALVYRRRHHLRASLTTGSAWGVVLMLAGLGLYAASTWPFDFRYIQQLGMVPVLAGALLAVGGWRLVKRCLPMLLLVLLSIPIGPRIYARLIIAPETYTLAATRLVLDQLPKVKAELRGPDLYFRHGGRTGSIALGEPRRGASLLLASLVIGVFVVFAQVRPFWQVAVMAVLAGPVVMLGNALRVFTWGVVTIYGQAMPTSGAPRAVAAVVSLLAAYAIFGLMCAILSNLVIETEQDEDDPRLEELGHA